MSRKRNKVHVLMSSDEDSQNDTGDESNKNGNSSRTSQRLRRKSEQKRFVLPSRRDIWDKIPSEYSKTSLSKISPKRTVNNFTKIHNSYNYDDYEDTSENESEGFITDSSENNQSTDEQNKEPKAGRIKNFKRRIKSCSSSDEDSKEKTPDTKETKKDLCDHPDTEIEGIISTNEVYMNNSVVDQTNVCIADDSDSDETISPAKRRRNTSALELNSDSSNSEDNRESQNTCGQIPSNESNASNLNQIDDPTATSNAHEYTSTADDNCSNLNNPSSDNIINIVSSDEDSTAYSNSSDSNDSISEMKDRSSKFRRKKEKLFQKFKDIQKVRKNTKLSQTFSNWNSLPSKKDNLST